MLPRYSKLLNPSLTVKQSIEAEVTLEVWRYTPYGVRDALKRSIEKFKEAGFNASFVQKDAVTFVLFAYPKNIHDVALIESTYQRLVGVNNLEA